MSKYRLLWITLAIFFITAPAAAQDTNIDSFSAKIIERYELTISPGTAAYLAPNGEHFAHLNRNELCIYPTNASLDAGQCVPIPEDLRRIDMDVVRWSPDSASLAFTSDFFRFLLDSDIWIFDLETNTFTNLTDDGDYRVALDDIASGEGWIDVTPQWVGDDIYFLRYASNEAGNVVPNVMRIARTGGDPEFVAELSSEYRFGVYSFAPLADGSAVVHNYDTRQTGDARAQLTTLPEGARRDLYIPGAEDLLQGIAPNGFSAAPEQNLVLVAIPAFYLAVPDYAPELSLFQLLDANSTASALTPIDPRYFVNNAGWSPDGQLLAYTVNTPLNPEVNGLYITDQPGQSGRLVVAGEFNPTTPTYQQGLTWATNNFLMVAQRDESTTPLTLIQIDES